jgi:3-hydroxyacyl-CoA dehydrogenase
LQFANSKVAFSKAALGYIHSSAGSDEVDSLFNSGRLRLASSIQDAVQNANIVQEQGPENVPFKQMLWPEVEMYASPDCLLWSSTSGIPASIQSAKMKSQARLLIVHPYNPPHIMPLLEIVPSPLTDPRLVAETLKYWKGLERVPVVLQKECTGFVSNRLAFALLREEIQLVIEGVVSVRDLDEVVESSMGPRWAVAGPFKSYHAGGGLGGIKSFIKNIGGTIQACWEESKNINVGDGWEECIIRQTREAYGDIQNMNMSARDEITKEILTTRKRVLEHVQSRT